MVLTKEQREAAKAASLASGESSSSSNIEDDSSTSDTHTDGDTPEYTRYLELQKKFGETSLQTEREKEEKERERKAEEKEEKEGLRMLALMKQLTYNKIKTPVFKGEKTDDPASHILKVNDWFEAEMVKETDQAKQFKITLEGKARQWFDDITVPDNFEDLTKIFLRQFSKVGRSKKQLHEKWRTLAFDPSTDDIENFIREVKQTAKQMGYDHEAVLNCLKSCMPDHVNIALYHITDLPQAIEMILDIFAKTSGKSTSSDLFSIHKDQPAQPKSVQFETDTEAQLNKQLTKLNEAADRFSDMFNKQEPYRPRIDGSGRGRGNYRGRGRGNYNSNYRGNSSGRDYNNNYRGNNYNPNYRGNNYQPNYRGNGRGSYNNNNNWSQGGRSQSRSRENDICYLCHAKGQWARDCKGDQANQQQNQQTQNTSNRGNRRGRGRNSLNMARSNEAMYNSEEDYFSELDEDYPVYNSLNF